MQFEISKYRQLIFSLLILIFSFSILAYLIFAWSPPTGQYPPLKNVPAPINVGDQDQVKSGGLGANTLAIARGAVFAYQGGNVGIGTTAPSEKLDIQGGRLRVGNTMIYDNEINRYNNDNLYIGYRTTANTILQANGGNVGIGTTAPTQKLDVAGYVKGTGLCIGNDCRTSWPSGGGTAVSTGLYGWCHVKSSGWWSGGENYCRALSPAHCYCSYIDFFGGCRNAGCYCDSGYSIIELGGYFDPVSYAYEGYYVCYKN